MLLLVHNLRLVALLSICLWSPRALQAVDLRPDVHGRVVDNFHRGVLRKLQIPLACRSIRVIPRVPCRSLWMDVDCAT